MAQSNSSRPLGVVSVGGLSIDLDRKNVWINGQQIHVVGLQYKLLELLVYDDRVVSQLKIVANLHPESFFEFKQSMPLRFRRLYSQLVSELNKKLEVSAVTIDTKRNGSARILGYVIRGERQSGWGINIRPPIKIAAE